MLHLKNKIFTLIAIPLLVTLIAIITINTEKHSSNAIESLPLLKLTSELTKIQVEQSLWLERCWQYYQTDNFISAKDNFHNRTALVNSKLNDLKFLINQKNIYVSDAYKIVSEQLIAVNQRYISYEKSAINILQLIENNQNIGKFKQQLLYQEKILTQELANLSLKVTEIIKLSFTDVKPIFLSFLLVFIGMFGIVIMYLLGKQIITQIGAEPNILIKMVKHMASGNININFGGDNTGIHKELAELAESIKNISKQTNELAKGNCSVQIIPRSESDMLSNAIITINGRLREIAISLQAAINGDYSQKITSRTKEDFFGQIIVQIVDKLQIITDTSQESNWLKTGQTELNEIMRGEQDLHVLTQNIINYLATYVNAQIGIFFLAEGDSFKLNSS
ncbi:hypothetical protein QUF50_09935, partial [Thiotrichales bacterium HSG1]|nr:hypothetical protein [Thiotrichales bacterium HSG1]